MNFMKPHLSFAPTISNLSDNVSGETTPELIEQPEVQVPTPRRRHPRVCETLLQSSNLNTDRVLEYLATKKNQVQVADATETIFLGYARTIKSFSPRRQSDIKFKIAQMIREEELAHLRESFDREPSYSPLMTTPRHTNTTPSYTNSPRSRAHSTTPPSSHSFISLSDPSNCLQPLHHSPLPTPVTYINNKPPQSQHTNTSYSQQHSPQSPHTNTSYSHQHTPQSQHTNTSYSQRHTPHSPHTNTSKSQRHSPYGHRATYTLFSQQHTPYSNTNQTQASHTSFSQQHTPYRNTNQSQAPHTSFSQQHTSYSNANQSQASHTSFSQQHIPYSNTNQTQASYLRPVCVPHSHRNTHHTVTSTKH